MIKTNLLNSHSYAFGRALFFCNRVKRDNLQRLRNKYFICKEIKKKQHCKKFKRIIDLLFLRTNAMSCLDKEKIYFSEESFYLSFISCEKLVKRLHIISSQNRWNKFTVVSTVIDTLSSGKTSESYLRRHFFSLINKGLCVILFSCLFA